MFDFKNLFTKKDNFQSEIDEQIVEKQTKLIDIFADDFYTTNESGQFLLHGIAVEPKEHLEILLNSAVIVADSAESEISDAICEVASLAGITKQKVAKTVQILDKLDFSDKTKYSAVFAEGNATRINYVLGDYEEVIDKCNFIYRSGQKLQGFSIVDAQKYLNKMKEMTERGERVLVVAYREEIIKKNTLSLTDFDKNFVLIGLLGFKEV